MVEVRSDVGILKKNECSMDDDDDDDGDGLLESKAVNLTLAVHPVSSFRYKIKEIIDAETVQSDSIHHFSKYGLSSPEFWKNRNAYHRNRLITASDLTPKWPRT